MVTNEQIQEINQQIVKAFRPERIILFGSYAYGEPTRDSDVDLLVIMPFEGHAARAALDVRRRIAPSFAIDILVRTAQDVQQRLRWNDSFLREIVEKGTILYESTDPRVD